MHTDVPPDLFWGRSGTLWWSKVEQFKKCSFNSSTLCWALWSTVSRSSDSNLHCKSFYIWQYKNLDAVRHHKCSNYLLKEISHKSNHYYKNFTYLMALLLFILFFSHILWYCPVGSLNKFETKVTFSWTEFCGVFVDWPPTAHKVFFVFF